MEFLDRREERARLTDFLLRAEGGMACLYGRRRIGKSRLLEEVLKGRADVISYCAFSSPKAAFPMSLTFPGANRLRHHPRLSM